MMEKKLELDESTLEMEKKKNFIVYVCHHRGLTTPHYVTSRYDAIKSTIENINRFPFRTLIGCRYVISTRHDCDLN